MALLFFPGLIGGGLLSTNVRGDEESVNSAPSSWG
jgi:hypothetical protein